MECPINNLSHLDYGRYKEAHILEVNNEIEEIHINNINNNNNRILMQRDWKN